LHGFNSVAVSNFPPEFQNREIWVIDPVARQSWSRPLDQASAGLTTAELNSLTPANNQYYQRGNRLYMAGGYGLQLVLPNGDPFNSTFDTLSAIDLPGIIDWVVSGAGTAHDHIRQISDPQFRVTGGAMYEINGRTHLVFGQDFQGNYTPGSNGIYTRQVRSFDIVDGMTLAVANPSATMPDSNYRRRDLNVVPIIRADAGGALHEELVALSGVFTTTFGAWTVPVEIDEFGNLTMDDALDADTFKQGMNNYQSARLGLYSESRGEMHTILFGGISLQYLNTVTGQIDTDNQLPFVNDISSLVIDSLGQYSQHRIGEFPLVADETGKRLRFGTNAEFFPAGGFATYGNGVFELDSIRQRSTLGYIYGGIVANGPHTRGVPDVTSIASNTIFEVVLIPVPEPSFSTITLSGLIVVGYAHRRPPRRRACQLLSLPSPTYASLR
jgi:hypothetical protein